MPLLITLILGIFFLIGIAAVKFFKNSDKIEHASIAVAFGAMLGIALFDIFPELLEIVEPSRWYLPVIGTAIGFGILVLLDHFIPEHEDEHEDDYSVDNMVHIGIIASIAIVIHNIIEGMAVYSLATTDVRAGFLLMIGVGLHNIPMGMFIYSTLKSREDIKKTIFIALSVVSTFIGGLIMMCLEPYITATFDGVLYGIALGMIAYIVVLELWPYIRKKDSKWTSIICSFIGLVIVLISVLFE